MVRVVGAAELYGERARRGGSMFPRDVELRVRVLRGAVRCGVGTRLRSAVPGSGLRLPLYLILLLRHCASPQRSRRIAAAAARARGVKWLGDMCAHTERDPGRWSGARALLLILIQIKFDTAIEI